jgi:hypothetical protein
VETEPDPVKVCLAQFNMLEFEDLYRGLLDQVTAFRRVDEAEVEDYALAMVGLTIANSGIPPHLVTRILKLIVAVPSEQYEDAHIAIVNGGYLSTPTGFYTLPDLKPMAEGTELTPLQTIVFSVGGFWKLAKQALCAPPA